MDPYQGLTQAQRLELIKRQLILQQTFSASPDTGSNLPPQPTVQSVSEMPKGAARLEQEAYLQRQLQSQGFTKLEAQTRASPADSAIAQNMLNRSNTLGRLSDSARQAYTNRIDAPLSRISNPYAQQGINTVGSIAGGFAGDYLGDRASEAVFGQSNGIGSQIGSFVGGLLGGFGAAALVGGSTFGAGTVAGGVVGTGVGSAVGSFIGSAFDALGNAIFGGNSQKANPAGDKGANYLNPANLPPPPFVGGQNQGSAYRVIVDGYTAFNDGTGRIRTVTAAFGQLAFFDVYGPVSGVSPKIAYSEDVQGVIINAGFEVVARKLDGSVDTRFAGLGAPTQTVTVIITSVQINRLDGQPNSASDIGSGVSTANTPFTPANPAPKPAIKPQDDPESPDYFPYLPSVRFGDNANALLDAQEQATPSLSPVLSEEDGTKPIADQPRQVAPIAPPSPPVATSPLLDSNAAFADKPQTKVSVNPFSGVRQPFVQPAYKQKAFVAKPYIAGVSNPADAGKPIDLETGLTREEWDKIYSPEASKITTAPTSNTGFPVKQNDLKGDTLPTPTTPAPKTQTIPQTPNQGDSPDAIKILASLTGIVGVIAALKIGSDFLVNKSIKIDDQTTSAAQQANTQSAVCGTMAKGGCSYEGIKEAAGEAIAPTAANAAANNAALNGIAVNQAAQDGVLAGIVGAIGKITGLLNNTVVDRTLAVMNLATNIHNAAMLTRDIGETLGSVVDNVISLTPLRFTNSEGSQVQFTDFIGSNFRAFLVSVLGVENYTSLVLNWQKANTIYHSAMGVLNTTQSMLDPISSAVEYGMENVSKGFNGLREDGVVSENAYPAMDETIRARRVNRFQRLNDTLEGAENIASNLSSVTSSAVSVKEDYKQLREDAKDFKDKAKAFSDADSEARAALKAELPTEITPITLAPAPAEDE